MVKHFKVLVGFLQAEHLALLRVFFVAQSVQQVALHIAHSVRQALRLIQLPVDERDLQDEESLWLLVHNFHFVLDDSDFLLLVLGQSKGIKLGDSGVALGVVDEFQELQEDLGEVSHIDDTLEVDLELLPSAFEGLLVLVLDLGRQFGDLGRHTGLAALVELLVQVLVELHELPVPLGDLPLGAIPFLVVDLDHKLLVVSLVGELPVKDGDLEGDPGEGVAVIGTVFGFSHVVINELEVVLVAFLELHFLAFFLLLDLIQVRLVAHVGLGPVVLVGPSHLQIRVLGLQKGTPLRKELALQLLWDLAEVQDLPAVEQSVAQDRLQEALQVLHPVDEDLVSVARE
mmetsp:Transcript_16586/g.15872  ORF Transcript_16586/g.15872 Transcript_16586/m.15872 type:complete len:343 (-) Transcript_16586:109-1137(-)